ncbi:tetraacyldisaccharide 4'-kinase [bacterium]|nr:tetraacyldisaccharide 4'-kinase [bacterium]
MKTYISKLHYKKELNGIDKSVLFGLKIVSIPYFIGSSIKNYLYKKNILKSYDTGCRVISIGNLTTGGTGKTPLTAEIANFLTQKGEKVCIVSRGYKGKLNNKIPNLISDGEKIYYDAPMAGDEPYWLAKNCKGAAVVTCSNRKKGIEFYKQKTGCNTFLLDDGFQHRKVKRDLNILVIDGEKKFGNELILPAGPLREPLTEIYRADKIIIVNKKNHNRGLRGYKRVLERALNRPVFLCDMKLDTPYNIETNEPFNYERVLAFCAIGQPEQFFNLLTANVAAQEVFEDHHRYSEEDIEYLIKKAGEHGVSALITTEKDAVKIKNLQNAKKIKIYAAKLVPNINIEEILL